jgi:ADP-heptose:LPS heptosyltransferase
MRIAVIQGGCFGDNVNSTLMFGPIKRKYPQSTIDVFTAERYSSPFVNNPHISRIIATATGSKNESLNLAYSTKPVGYDLVINSHPLVNKKWSSDLHPELGENLILAWVSTLESLGIEYDCPLEPELYLTEDELQRSRRLIESIDRRSGIVLMECEGESGQSFWNHNWTNQVIQRLVQMDKTVLVSCINLREKIEKINRDSGGAVKWLGSESIRTVSGVFDYCDGFISVSSGLSNACNVTQRSKSVKWVEVVNSLVCSSNVIRSEGKTFWHQNDLGDFLQALPELV